MQYVEDATILMGRGRYANNFGVKSGTLYAAVLRSSYAHVELGLIDFTAALKAPRVRAALTGANLPA